MAREVCSLKAQALAKQVEQDGPCQQEAVSKLLHVVGLRGVHLMWRLIAADLWHAVPARQQPHNHHRSGNGTGAATAEGEARSTTTNRNSSALHSLHRSGVLSTFSTTSEASAPVPGTTVHCSRSDGPSLLSSSARLSRASAVLNRDTGRV